MTGRETVILIFWKKSFTKKKGGEFLHKRYIGQIDFLNSDQTVKNR